MSLLSLKISTTSCQYKKHKMWQGTYINANLILSAELAKLSFIMPLLLESAVMHRGIKNIQQMNRIANLSNQRDQPVLEITCNRGRRCLRNVAFYLVIFLFLSLLDMKERRQYTCGVSVEREFSPFPMQVLHSSCWNFPWEFIV